MKINRLLLLILLFVMNTGAIHSQSRSSNEKISQTYSVCGKVMVTEPYCGGAYPEPGELELLTAPRPYTGKVFYVRSGDTNTINKPIVKSFTINTTGNFCIVLPKGKYIFIQKDQVKKLDLKKYELGENYQTSKECLINWWKTPYYKFEIKTENIVDLEFNFYHQCFVDGDTPCIGYFGPMPP